jgi:phosphopantothenoylcysteine decarboxylase/phosphopantothenate--cysteine ligase
MPGRKGRTVLITAGPTREHLDPVRFLSNDSSGRMGYALAAAVRKRGARVVLISGPTSLPVPPGVRRIDVLSARDMLAAARRALPESDWVIGCAAVADWRPARPAGRKMKSGGPPPTIRLVRNPDILMTLAREARPGTRLAGFALETENLRRRALAKMARKGLDLIVANAPDALGGERTRAWILTRDGTTTPFAGTKASLADKILDRLETLP